MATITSEFAARLDIIAGAAYGAITQAGISALFRANPTLPLAMREGYSVEIPENTQRLNYGATFQGWNYAVLAALIATNAIQYPGDFDSLDFDPRDWFTEI